MFRCGSRHRGTHLHVLDRIVYRSMQAHIRKLDGLPPEVDELAAEAIEDAIEGAPLLGNYSSESVDEQRDTQTILRDRRSLSPGV